MERARTALVLGAGGTVGMAYHAGVLKALSDVAGFRAADVDLIVGTSAGSMVGAQLRSGWTAEDLWGFAMGTHPELAGATPEEVRERRAGILVPASKNPLDLARRSLGSAYVLTRSMLRLPGPAVPPFVGRLFPAGFLSMKVARAELAESLPEAWPEEELWLVAVDTVSGRRVVFGRPGSPEASLHDAVAASCAVPGVYPPVRVGHRVLVDGGVDSTTHLDLAVKAGAKLIVGVVPMAYDTEDGPDAFARLTRRQPARWLSEEVAYARARGAEVLLFRPSASEVRLHGGDLLRAEGWEEVAEQAYDATVRALDTDRAREALAGHVAAATPT